jgi:hypothetical protein
MPKVRLREPSPPARNGDGPNGVAIEPLAACGLVVTRAALVATLSGLVPGLRDVVATEDGAHFWLMLGEEGDGARATQE